MPAHGIDLFILRGAFRHPERSEMSDVRSCKDGTVRTESKDLAPHHHFSFLISHSIELFKEGYDEAMYKNSCRS